MPGVLHLIRSFVVFGRRKRTRRGERGAGAGAQQNGAIVEKETDLEVSALIVAMDDPLGEAAAPKPMRTRRTDAKPLQNGNGIIASQPWPRICCPVIMDGCRLHHGATVSAIVSVSATETETESATEIVIIAREIETMIARVGAIMITTVNVVIGRKSERESIDAASTEVHTTNFPMVTDLNPRDDDAPMTKMNMVVEIRETRRYDLRYSLQMNHHVRSKLTNHVRRGSRGIARRNELRYVRLNLVPNCLLPQRLLGTSDQAVKKERLRRKSNGTWESISLEQCRCSFTRPHPQVRHGDTPFQRLLGETLLLLEYRPIIPLPI